VDESELVEQLEIYVPAGGDRVLASKRIVSAIKDLKKNSILKPIRGSESRFEVSPVLRLLFTADDVQAMAAAYRNLAGQSEAVEMEPSHATD